mmetsp:Transcript_890/g.2749  ORF Transcript_890/g.2749 Transcript_890/m.2749 type:complete len:107 (-) Transcript_890:589-909(-)
MQDHVVAGVSCDEDMGVREKFFTSSHHCEGDKLVLLSEYLSKEMIRNDRTTEKKRTAETTTTRCTTRSVGSFSLDSSCKIPVLSASKFPSQTKDWRTSCLGQRYKG